MLLLRHAATWYTMYTFLGALVRKRILSGAKFTLRASLAFFYW